MVEDMMLVVIRMRAVRRNELGTEMGGETKKRPHRKGVAVF